MPGFNYLNFTDMAANAYTMGRQKGRELAIQNALKSYETDSEGTQNALTRIGAFDEANQIGKMRTQKREDQQYAGRQQALGMANSGDIAGARGVAAQTGDFDLHQELSKMDDQQKAVAAEHAGTLAAIGLKLRKEVPADQRAAVIQSLKSSLIQRGFKPEEIDGFAQDPSDEKLDALIGSSLSIKEAIEMQNKERDDAETLRHHQAVEAMPKIIGNGGVAFDPSTGEVVARNPKTFSPKSGGSGKVKVPGKAIPLGPELDPNEWE